MKNEIPGLRTPSRSECEWIQQVWLPELQKRKTSRGKICVYGIAWGMIYLFIGLYLVEICMARMSGRDVNVAGISAIFILAAGIFVFYMLLMQGKINHRILLDDLTQGTFQVASAYSVRIKFAYSSNSNTKALTEVCLPDGKKLKGVYDIPRQCAEPLIKRGIHHIPILLIRIEGYSSLLTIPHPALPRYKN